MDGSEACVGSFSRNRRPRVRSNQPVESIIAGGRARSDGARDSFFKYNGISTRPARYRMQGALFSATRCDGYGFAGTIRRVRDVGLLE